MINIDSKHRNKLLYPYSSNFSIRFDEKIKYVKSLKVKSIELPSNNIYPQFYHNISTINNNDIMTINGTVLIVPSNTYNEKTLIDILNTLTTDVTFSYNNNTVNIISNVGPIDIIFNKGLELSNSLGQVLGFNNLEYLNITSIDSTNSITLDNNNYYILDINDYGNVYNGGSIYNTTNNIQDCKNFLAKISISNCTHDCIQLLTIDRPLNSITLDKLDIRLLDSYNKIMNITNINYSFTLIVETE